jgi:peptidyl-prolyl cis-trans isomerase SurA
MKKAGSKVVLLGLCAVACLCLPSVSRAQSNPVTVEQIVARVNNSIITMSDYQKELDGLPQEVQQDCQGCLPDKVQSELRERQKNLLRDMIDQQLLIERAKDMDISVETDLVKRLDEVRKDNNLATLDDLQKAVEGQGLNWDDYKTQLRDGLLTQEVIRREVGGRMDIGTDEVKKYYDSHKQEFVRPEEVDLSDILLSTEGKSPEETASVHTRAEDIRNRVARGEDFAEIAKRYSEGPTAQQGGELGVYERGQLDPQIEAAVFKMEKGQITDVIQTKAGFDILRVNDHFDAGLQPLDKVDGEISNRLYQQKMQPALRDYLAQLREESYVTVAPGYTDTAAVPGGTAIQEVAPTPDASDKKKNKKKVPLPKING